METTKTNSNQVKDLFASLVAVRSKVKIIEKSKQGHGYKYAPLKAIHELLQPLCADEDIAYIQIPTSTVGERDVEYGFFQDQNGRWREKPVNKTETGTEVSVKTIIISAEGEVMEFKAIRALIDEQQHNDLQSLGSAITYLKRYHLSAIFGIASEEDVDTRDVTPTHKRRQKKQPKKKKVSDKGSLWKDYYQKIMSLVENDKVSMEELKDKIAEEGYDNSGEMSGKELKLFHRSLKEDIEDDEPEEEKEEPEEEPEPEEEETVSLKPLKDFCAEYGYSVAELRGFCDASGIEWNRFKKNPEAVFDEIEFDEEEESEEDEDVD